MRLVVLLLLLVYSCEQLDEANAIRCYQCSSDEDKTTDSCGAYEPFDEGKNSPVDCSGEDAASPGTFCYKSIQQGPRGFLWDGRWRTVTRRCAQHDPKKNGTGTGTAGLGCDWGYHENGVFWEECYCETEKCNGAPGLLPSGSPNTVTLLATICGSLFIIIQLITTEWT